MDVFLLALALVAVSCWFFSCSTWLDTHYGKVDFVTFSAQINNIEQNTFSCSNVGTEPEEKIMKKKNYCILIAF